MAIPAAKSLVPTSKSIVMILLGASCLLIGCGSDTVELSDPTTSTVTEVAGEEVSDDPTEAVPATDATSTTTTEVATTVDGLDELADLDVSPCSAPLDQELYVDVAIDDPDGGLNMRTAPGIENDVVGVFPRSSAVVTTGACAALGTVDWWKVTSPDGAPTGWVSSRFLSEFPVFNPGVGTAIDDTDNVGISGETLDELALQIADSYGFDEDVVLAVVEEPEALDAIGGSVTYELTGLKDDASNGYRVEIDFDFNKDDQDSGEVVGYTATKITNYALCSRGVTDDGLCT